MLVVFPKLLMTYTFKRATGNKIHWGKNAPSTVLVGSIEETSTQMCI